MEPVSPGTATEQDRAPRDAASRPGPTCRRPSRAVAATNAVCSNPAVLQGARMRVPADAANYNCSRRRSGSHSRLRTGPGGYAPPAYIAWRPSASGAGVGAYGHRVGDGRQLARSLLAVAETDAEMGVREGVKMAKEPDVYTTIGHECGCCGHRHRSVREAGRCLAEYRRQEPSDRRVVAVAADAPWPPTEGRDLNDAELDALYVDVGDLAASGEHEQLVIFAASEIPSFYHMNRVRKIPS